MRDVLAAIGLGDYILDHVNEIPEPNAGGKIYGDGSAVGGPPRNCPYDTALKRKFVRSAYMGGWNNWQGVCKTSDGEICYSVQGPHMEKYAIMNDAPTYEMAIIDPISGIPLLWVPRPGVPDGQNFDNVHAFRYYAWISDWSSTNDPSIPGHIKVGNKVLCPHIPSPSLGASNPNQ